MCELTISGARSVQRHESPAVYLIRSRYWCHVEQTARRKKGEGFFVRCCQWRAHGPAIHIAVPRAGRVLQPLGLPPTKYSRVLEEQGRGNNCHVSRIDTSARQIGDPACRRTMLQKYGTGPRDRSGTMYRCSRPFIWRFFCIQRRVALQTCHGKSCDTTLLGQM